MTTLKGIFPNPKPTRRKNFIQENVKNLRRMEQFFQTKETDELRKLQLQKKPADKYRNVTSRINSSFRGRKHESFGKTIIGRSHDNLAEEGSRAERKISEPIDHKNFEERKVHGNAAKLSLRDRSKKDERMKTEKSKSVKRSPSNPELLRETSNISDSRERDYVKYRNQGIQTLDTDNIETLYKEGVIRYPSSRSGKNASSPKRNVEASPGRESPASPSERDDEPTSPLRESLERTRLSPSNVDQTDFSKFNRANGSIAGKIATQLSNGVLPTNYRKGVVPKYIRDRKEALLQKEERIKAAAAHPDCPEGHVPLPDEERKETLRMLRKRHQEFVSELNMMPIKTDTLRSQKRKMEIEKQLNKLEEGIKVFSRPKVYVKVNA